MKHKMKLGTHHADKELGDAGEWIAFFVVWCIAIGMGVAVVSVLLSPAE
jgi:hypothetical protein